MLSSWLGRPFCSGKYPLLRKRRSWHRERGKGGQGGLLLSHESAAFPPERPLEANGRVHVFAAGTSDAAQRLTEQEQYVPVEFGRALHVAALPGLAHQVRDVVSRYDPTAL